MHSVTGRLVRAGMLEAVRKVPLGRSLDLLRCLFPDEYSFHPRSWFLPQQFVEFCDAARHPTEPTPSRLAPPAGTLSHRRDQQQQQLLHQQQQQQQQLMVIQPTAKSSCSHSVFIVKPDEGSQGEGIYLIQVMSLYWTLCSFCECSFAGQPLALLSVLYQLMLLSVITTLEINE